MSTLGDRIRELRGTRTQKWLAGQLGIPATTLSNYENNKSELNFATIQALKTIFKVNTDWLLFGTGPVGPEETESRWQKAEPDREDNGGAPLCLRCKDLLDRLLAAHDRLDQVQEQAKALLRENGELKAEMGGLRK
jgi:transcriptional regulator with XRE-family HTH domain